MSDVFIYLFLLHLLCIQVFSSTQHIADLALLGIMSMGHHDGTGPVHAHQRPAQPRLTRRRTGNAMLKKMLITGLITALMTGLVAASESSTVNDQKKELIHALIHQKLRPVDDLVDEVRGIAVNVFRQSVHEHMVKPGHISDQEAGRFVDDVVNDVVENDFRRDLMELMYAIIDKYYSEEELEAIVRFNNTPAGKKAIEVNPLILRDSSAAAQELSKGLGPQIIEKMKERLRLAQPE